ncbi:MAG: lipoprotein-releasing ABC transporter permease subunit [Methylobacteriaceae bacterium]|nr:lipoprotein-releasing ABC transporter permease subunit [Methylobacteriaceae bacterium]
MQHSAAAAAPRRAAGVFAPFEWAVALRYLRPRRSSGFVSVLAVLSFLGVLLGVAQLIIVMSVMNGFRKELLEKIIGVNGHLFVQAADTPLTDFDEVASRIAKAKGVTVVLPMVEGQALASSPYQSSGVLVRGVRERDLKRLPGVEGKIQLGTIEGFDAEGGLAIGQRLAEHLSLRIGDSLTLVAPKGAQTPFGTAPRIKSYPVTAIFRIGMSEFDGTLVYMPFEEAQLYFNKEGEASLIEAFVVDPDRMDEVRESIDKVIGRPAIMTDWRQRNKTFFDALAVERSVMFIILTMNIIVSALGIVSGLVMLVKDKGRAIGVLRSMGATRGAVMRIFLIIGGGIGIVGTAAGVVVGLLVARNLEPIRTALNTMFGLNLFPKDLYFLSHLPSDVRLSDVVAVVALALGLSFLATLYPSRRAARLDPVEALRYE